MGELVPHMEVVVVPPGWVLFDDRVSTGDSGGDNDSLYVVDSGYILYKV